MVEEAHYHRIQIENEPLLTDCGFTEFRLPLNGNATKMVLYNDKFKSMITYVDWDKHNTIDKAVKLLRDKLLDEQHVHDQRVIESLCTYFRNACIFLAEDPDNSFFKNGNGNGKAEQNNKKESENAAQKLLGLAEDQCSDLFLDQFGTPYVAIRIGEHTETLALKSSRFRNWLYRIYHTSEKNVINSEAVSSVLNILQSNAEFGTTKNLDLRVASLQEEPFTIYYDLADKDCQVVKITPEGWSIENNHIIFRRHKSQRPQVYPSREYSLDVFDRFMDLMNIKGQDERLVEKGYIMSLFYPDIPKPISVVMAEHGSAKTTEHELQKKLVDPSGTETLTFPRDINELVQKLSHNYVAYFDNVSKLPDWVSDQLCRASTGSGFSKRALYTDDEDVIYNFIRCTGINGINITGLRQDLLDRAILRKRERIPKEKRRTKKDVHAEFDSLRPQLLGYIFDVMVKVLKVKSQGGINLKELPRMADFAEIAEIACRCMGCDDNEFLKAYDKNIELQVEEAIAANLVSNAIIKLMEARPEWIGTASQLLADLEQAAAEIKINLNSKGWPKGANVLSGRLDEVKTNLREIGIVINKEASKDPKTRVKTILIINEKVKVGEVCKQSFGSSDRSEGQNRAQIASDKSNDTKKMDPSRTEGDRSEGQDEEKAEAEANDTSDISERSDSKESFEKNPQNEPQKQNGAQKEGMNDPNGSNGTLHTSQQQEAEPKAEGDYWTQGKWRESLPKENSGTLEPPAPAKADIEPEMTQDDDEAAVMTALNSSVPPEGSL
jgi:hypothetical protein